MGLILDSTVVITGGRQGHSVRQILEQIQTAYSETEIGLSVVTVVELTHGVYRAKVEERRQRRQAFVDELTRDVPVASCDRGDSQTGWPDRGRTSRAGREHRVRGPADRGYCPSVRFWRRHRQRSPLSSDPRPQSRAALTGETPAIPRINFNRRTVQIESRGRPGELRAQRFHPRRPLSTRGRQIDGVASASKSAGSLDQLALVRPQIRIRSSAPSQRAWSVALPWNSFPPLAASRPASMSETKSGRPSSFQPFSSSFRISPE